jgi:DNA-binding MarR family transcriptional regulator
MTNLPSLPYDPSESITYWILNAAHRLEHLLNEELRPLNMTLRQAEVLVLLALHGELSQVDLARHMGIEPPTLAGIAVRMEETGWIERSPCRTDRRKKLLRLTDRVVPIWSQMLERARNVRAQAGRGLTAEQLATLHLLLDRVHDNIVAALDAQDAARENGRALACRDGACENGHAPAPARRVPARARRGG